MIGPVLVLCVVAAVFLLRAKSTEAPKKHRIFTSKKIKAFKINSLIKITCFLLGLGIVRREFSI